MSSEIYQTGIDHEYISEYITVSVVTHDYKRSQQYSPQRHRCNGYCRRSWNVTVSSQRIIVFSFKTGSDMVFNYVTSLSKRRETNKVFNPSIQTLFFLPMISFMNEIFLINFLEIENLLKLIKI